MICRNCHAQVDDDLVFCTNCGARLFENQNETQTVSIQNANSTNGSKEPTKNSASRLKWAALIVALVAIPASIFGVYLLTDRTANQTVSPNVNKPATPKSTPRKENTNQNANANLMNANINANAPNANQNVNAAKSGGENEIMNERIEIAPKSHYARPFEVTGKTAEIVGNVRVLQGEKIDGLVYSQEMYDNHFPDPNYKIFSFGEDRNSEIRQTLVAEKYVIVFINNSDQPVTIQSKISLK